MRGGASNLAILNQYKRMKTHIAVGLTCLTLAK
jgi:hypothetical protein